MPAAHVARNGFTVTQDLARYMASAISGIDNFFVNDPTWAIDFAPNGTMVQLNDTMYRKRYGDTLETVARYGAQAFYNGAIAQTTIAALQKANGTMTLDDLRNYSVSVMSPSQITYRDFKITSTSAPSSGEVVLSVMKIIEGYDDIGQAATLNISTHRLDEAMRFAYGEASHPSPCPRSRQRKGCS
ncbi:hypothetical protein MRB53_039867 [Persea americana]|nr:hypothetical protein MRB53_039867 [Persea americana]